MKYFVFVYDEFEGTYFCAGEFERYAEAEKEALRQASDYYTSRDQVKILVHVPELDTWREVRTQERSLH